MDDPITAFDLQRMLFGEAPPLFHLEIVVRTVIIYTYTLLLLRWLGSRTIGQLSTVEFLLVIALGSAVGDAMFYPDVPLLHALLVVTIVVVANKGLDMLIARFKRAERVIDGEPAELIADGVIAREFLDSKSMGQSELFQQLRHRGIENLGQVRAAFVEPDGAITVFRFREARPGLPIVPPWKVRAPRTIRAGVELEVATAVACMTCGNVSNPAVGAPLASCTKCGGKTWTPARRPQEVEDETPAG